MTARRVTDPDELVAFYRGDRAAHIYALADLEEPYWSASTWWREGDAVVGVVGLPGDEAPLVYAVSTRDPAGTLMLLDSLLGGLPPATLLSGPVGLGDLLTDRRRVAWHRPYHRYVLPDPSLLGDPGADVVDLGPDDADELAELHACDPGAAFFRPVMLADHTFAGLRRDGRLVAAAGTHVVSRRARAAAIGAVVTDPAWRGRGLAEEATRGVVRRLRGRADVVGLNCADGNAAARRLWDRLGCRMSLGYEEAELA